LNNPTDYSGIPSNSGTVSVSSPDGGCDDTPATSPDSRPVGNQGMKEPYKPVQSAGFGMGPFDADVEEARDLRVDSKMRIIVPGFEGTFFDPDEIEFYLRQRGVYIPPAADFVSAEIDVNDFSNETIDSAAAFSAADSIGSTLAGAATTTTTIGMVTTSIDAAITDPLPISTVTTSTGFQEFGGPMTTARDFGLPGMKDDLLDVNPMPSVLTPSPLLSDNLDLDFSMLDSLGPFEPSITKLTKRKVTINVATLVDELVWRSVCLGRAPGVRPKDVNLAFWLATSPS
jgi:hypothetical protein